jgi:hypothetical protein
LLGRLDRRLIRAATLSAAGFFIGRLSSIAVGVACSRFLRDLVRRLEIFSFGLVLMGHFILLVVSPNLAFGLAYFFSGEMRNYETNDASDAKFGGNRGHLPSDPVRCLVYEQTNRLREATTGPGIDPFGLSR